MFKKIHCHFVFESSNQLLVISLKNIDYHAHTYSNATATRIYFYEEPKDR